MINKSKLALIAALAVSIASPAFAQSFSRSEGTGNELPFAYGANQQTAVRESSRHSQVAVPGTRQLYNYAPIGSAPLPNVATSSSATGGGSAGYNAMVETY